MNGVTTACRWVLGSSFLVASLAKVLGGDRLGIVGWTDWALAAYEAAIVLAVFARRDRAAAAMALLLLLCGCVIAVVVPTPCNCLGRLHLSQGAHLMVAGGLGLVASTYFAMACWCAPGVSVARTPSDSVQQNASAAFDVDRR